MTIRSTLPGGDQSALRHLNTRRVLEALYDGPPLTISGVARVTGLSRPTAQAILASLTDSGLLRPDGHDMIKTGGRPAQRYRFNAAAGLLAGIDIGAHAVAVRIADLNGVLQTGVRRAVPADLPAGERLQTALTLLDQALPHQTARLWAAGVGTPGIVDSGGAVRLSVAVPGWTGVRLAEEIGRRLDCPVAAMKDANLAVLAEHRHGTGRDVSHVLYVHVGHRLGVGLLIDGHPFTGGTGAAGEIGRHPVLGWEEAPSRLLAEAGAGAVEAVFARARQGEQRALSAVDGFARALANGIGAMVLAMDPRLIVIGGGVAKAGTTVLDPIARHLASICYEVPDLQISTLGEDAVTIGAIEVARDRVRAELFTDS
ncbi:ROK family transcriptional regulator [Nonomuraea dietziae]|uniref:Putative NBD/HSP70 family sugar kinase n=1 Tax=Nonomuraea dietziae TaxID=65515 RepID=A0A7W5VQU2_9ACTN|nr:ROK family transcriptional regulator [Nonomuraea dietziae]MBB3732707.1 putative NBD/HSP70 family sugar kinase [Nonomuraea dietziae]